MGEPVATEAKPIERLDRYEILADLASGGMATVYLARLAGAGGFERMVAIKRLHPHLEKEEEFIQMFLDEARIAARLHHPNAVSTLEIGSSERGYYLVMDYIEGATLSRLLSRAAQKKERIPEPIVLSIICDTLAGLHAAHELKDDDGVALELVHRDVSPQNVLLGLDGSARITDFGVARAVSKLAQTRAGQLKGKLGYMAPEQAKGGQLDRRADVYAMGIVLWESLTGKRLLGGRTDSDAETLNRVLNMKIPNVRDLNDSISEQVAEVVAHALQREIEDRYESCNEFLEALEAAAKAGNGIASSREVGRYVENTVGAEVAARRESIRSVITSSAAIMASAPASGSQPSLSGSGSVPNRLSHSGVSSVSAAAMAMSEQTHPTSVGQVASIPPAQQSQGRSSSLAIGLLAGALVVALGGIAMMAMRSNDQPAPAGSPVAPSAPAPKSPEPKPTATKAATPAASASADEAKKKAASPDSLPDSDDSAKAKKKAPGKVVTGPRPKAAPPPAATAKKTAAPAATKKPPKLDANPYTQLGRSVSTPNERA